MNKITEKLTMNPSLLTYGMIGMTTVILAALTVFDSSVDNTNEETSYVSQLFAQESPEEESGLLSSILPSSQEEDASPNSSTNLFTGGKSKKTRRHKKKHANKKTRAGRK
jgi:hypothetical protein